MKIDRLRAFMSRDKDRPRVVVAIDTDDGLTGWGECYNHGPDKALLPAARLSVRLHHGDRTRGGSSS